MYHNALLCLVGVGPHFGGGADHTPVRLAHQFTVGKTVTVVQVASFVVVMSQLNLWVRAVTEAPTA